MKTDNVNFSGHLIGKMEYLVNNLPRVRETKPIYCCTCGDYKFIKSINKLCGQGQGIFVNRDDGLISKRLVFELDKSAVDKLIKVSFLENILMQVSKIQRAFFKNKSITKYIYQLDERQYRRAKEMFGFDMKNFKKFEENIRQSIDDKEKVRYFF